jgi:hypothetical protein
MTFTTDHLVHFLILEIPIHVADSFLDWQCSASCYPAQSAVAEVSKIWEMADNQSRSGRH